MPLVLAFFASVPASAQLGPIVYGIQNADNVELHWGPTPGETYTVFRTDDLSRPFVAIGSGPPPFVDVGAVPGPPANPEHYYYYVETRDAMSNRWTSNLAFKINIALVPGPSPYENPVSLPYFFFPHGSIGVPVTASDFCMAFPFVSMLVKSPGVPCSDLLRFKSCQSTLGSFPLAPGEGFYVRVDSPQVLHLVGSHDDAFAANKGGSSSVTSPVCATCERAERLISIPYHALAQTAEDACAEMTAGGAPAVAILDYRNTTERFLRHRCGTSTFDFALQPGRGYLLEAGSSDARWSPNVY